MMTCRSCRHPERHEIDLKLGARVPLRNIAIEYGVSVAALYRHRTKCLTKTLVRAIKTHENSQLTMLVIGIKRVISRALDAELAPGIPDHKTALKAVDIMFKLWGLYKLEPFIPVNGELLPPEVENEIREI